MVCHRKINYQYTARWTRDGEQRKQTAIHGL